MNYDEFASIYDTTCTGIDGDIDFFIRTAKSIGYRTLEVGCGTGRVYIPLKKAGIAVTGIDTSEKMLSILRDKCGKEGVIPDVRLESAADLIEENVYDSIFLPYRVFMHFDTHLMQTEVLKRLRRALRTDGQIVIDLFNPDLARIAKGSSYQLLNKTKKHLVWLWEEFDSEKQIVSNVFRVEKLNEAGEVISTVAKEFSARWFFQREFKKLVQEAGLIVKKIYANYENQSFTGKQNKMIWVLGKQ